MKSNVSPMKPPPWAPIALGCTIALAAILSPPMKAARAEHDPSSEPAGTHDRFEAPLEPFPRPRPRRLPEFPLDPIVPSAPLGYLPGSAGVDGGGAATYSIPLAVPPGVRGMQPNLSLSYSSKGENGILGVGWSLIGGSQIERCQKTLRSDGVTSGHDFSAGDALCLNGAKLVQVGTTPEGPEYRTEASPFDKVVHDEATDTFEVRSADGRISTYKPLRLPRNEVVDPNADNDPSNDRKELAPWRVTMAEGGEVVLMWPLDQVADRFGNAIRYRYQTTTSSSTPQGQGHGTSTVLERITYTHHASQPYGATREVVFEYASRPEGDRSFSYVNGLRLNQDRRLQRIVMVAPSVPGGGKEVQWTYQIDYLSSPSGKTGRSQLASVQQCDAAGACGWKKQFSWQGQDQPLHIQASYTAVSETDEAPWVGCEPAGIVSTETRPILLDADGDGRQDILLLHTEGLDSCASSLDTNQFKWKLLLSQAGYAAHTVSNDYFIDNGTGQLAPGRYRVADVNNDGRDDLIAGIDEGDDSLSAHGGRFKYR